jgi:pimeloyl-ACP methyl ester carboxylesterase
VTEPQGRLRSVVEHWAPRMQAAGIPFSEALRLAETAGEWPRWCAVWSAEGERHQEQGEAALAEGRGITAGEAFLRAALCFHFAQFMFFDDLEQKQRASLAKVAAYARAAPLLLPTARAVAVPLGRGSLRGYLRRPGAEPAPLAVLVPGSDSTKEEFASLEEHFLRRGLATFSFDGPGQGEGRSHGTLQPEWSGVLRAVLDALQGAPGLTGRVGVLGMAFGGHLVLQGAAAAPELGALVCMNGFFDMGAFWERMPEVYRANMGFALGGDGMEATRSRAARFTLADAAPPGCPTLVVHGAKDRIFPPAEARRITEFAGSAATLVELDEGNHVCNNIAHVYRPLVADWMAQRLGGRLMPIPD